MIVYFGGVVTVTAQGETWRTEVCESCGLQFHYRVEFAAAGQAHNPYFLDTADSSRRAEQSAGDRLDHALRNHVFPVPCPHCNLYQPYMVPSVKSEQFPDLVLASRLLAAFSPIVGFVSCIATGFAADNFGGTFAAPAAMAVWMGLPVLMIAGSLWFWRTRRRWQAEFDPNAVEHEESRRRVAAALALKPEEYTRLQIPPTPAPDVRIGGQPERRQLAGQTCVRCGKRIPGDFDSHFCRACHLPVHNRCVAPTEGGWCSVCGAADPTT